jgi:hypothetical protein
VVLLFVIGSAGMMRYFDGKHKPSKLIEKDRDDENSR